MDRILRNKLFIFIFAVPALLLFTIFVILPIFSTFFLGFLKSDGINSSQFIGFMNYRHALGDSQFWKSNFASLFLALLAVIFDSILAIAVAILLSNYSARFQKMVRSAYLMPLVMSVTVISQLWLAIYNPDWGLLNTFFQVIGLDFLKTRWLINQNTALVCVAVVGMWQWFGTYMLLAYSGVKSIPKQYYEAATIDGANFLQATFKITLPLLAEISKTVIIMGIFGGLYTFPQVYVMTGGGPGDITLTIMMYIYRNVFSNQYYGYGAAVSALIIIQTFLIILVINNSIAKDKVEF